MKDVIFKLFIYTFTALLMGCGGGFVKNDKNVYKASAFDPFIDEYKKGHFKIRDNSEIFLEEGDEYIVAKEIEFGINVKIYSYSDIVACGKDGRDSPSLIIDAQKIKGAPFIELVGESAEYCQIIFSDDSYTEYLDAKALKPGASGVLVVLPGADVTSFQPKLSEVIAQGNTESQLIYKKRIKLVKTGLKTQPMTLCTEVTLEECRSSIIPETAFLEGEKTVSLEVSSMVLSSNKRIVGDKITISSGSNLVLNNYSLLLEANEIIIEKDVKFRGYAKTDTASCNNDGLSSGDLILMATSIRGAINTELYGMNAGQSCSLTKRYAHCRSTQEDVIKDLKNARSFKGGASGDLVLLEGVEPNLLQFNSHSSKGSNPYTFKAYANHHWGFAGANSCRWSKFSVNKAGAPGKQGKVTYVKEGVEWD